MKYALAVSLLVTAAPLPISAVEDWTFQDIPSFGSADNCSDPDTFLPRAEFGTYTNGGVGFLFGGRCQDDFALAAGEYYNDIWSLRSAGGTVSLAKVQVNGNDMPSIRSRAGFAVSNEYMLVVGGQTPTPGPGGTTLPGPVSDVSWLFNRTSGMWISLPPTSGGPLPRFAASVATDIGGESSMFYVFGGIGVISPQNQGIEVKNDYWEFDVSSLTWTLKSNANARYGSKATQLGSVSYFFAGATSFVPPPNLVNNFAIFTKASDGTVTSGLLSPSNSPNVSQGGFTAIRDGASFLLAGGTETIGGTNLCGTPQPPTTLKGNNVTYIYDVSAGSWSEFPTGATHGGVIDAGLMDLSDDFAYLLGGFFYNCTIDGGSAVGSGRVNVIGGVYRLSTATPAPTQNPTASPTPAPTSAGFAARDSVRHTAAISAAVVAFFV